MRIGAQDVQVLSPHDPDIEALELALDAAEEAYEAARDEKVSEADERKLETELDAIKAAFDARHGLSELAAKVVEARKAVEEIYNQYNQKFAEEFGEEGVA